MTSYLEKNGTAIFNITFTTFSSLVLIANFFIFTHRINTALYFSNILSLVLATIMIMMYPNWLYDKYKDLYYGLLNNYGMNIYAILYHIIPVYLFRNRQKFSELLEFNTIYDSAFMLMLYYILFQDHLHNIYPLTKYQLITMCMAYFMVWTAVYYLHR
jgi:hypothetical protein